MPAVVKVRDAKKRVHEVTLLEPGEDPFEQACSHLRDWAEHGTTEIKEPFKLVGVEEMWGS